MSSIALVDLARNVGGVTTWALPTRLHQVIHPIILESIAVGVKSLWFRNQLHFFVVVGSSSIGGNHSSLEIGVLKVGTRVVNLRLLLLGPLPRLLLHVALHDRHTRLPQLDRPVNLFLSSSTG